MNVPNFLTGLRFVAVPVFAVLFIQWVRSSMKEAAREDRRLDLAERRSTSSVVE